jgi:hypothetical protein
MERIEKSLQDGGVPMGDIGNVTASPESVGAENVDYWLRQTSNVGLIKAYAVLTHKIDALRRMPETAQSFRDQRDRLEAEILRRMA